MGSTGKRGQKGPSQSNNLRHCCLHTDWIGTTAGREAESAPALKDRAVVVSVIETTTIRW